MKYRLVVINIILYILCYMVDIIVGGGKKVPERPPNCLKCEFFKVTWDPMFPRSCEIFSIKCTNLPSAEVFRATGSSCPSFKLNEKLT